MGLVATWLSGIGLAEAVPTFQAAGIVTPSALAELDVAHFEALGVSDPDDRRKLFYLVQRIKMAVHTKQQAQPSSSSSAEDHPAGALSSSSTSTTSEQVDAVIQGSMPSNSPMMVMNGKQSSSMSSTNHSRRSSSSASHVHVVVASESKESSPTSEPKDTPEYREPPKEEEEDAPSSSSSGSTATTPSVRRSRRIAGKVAPATTTTAQEATTTTTRSSAKNSSGTKASSKSTSAASAVPAPKSRQTNTIPKEEKEEEEEGDTTKVQSLRSKKKLLEKRHSRRSMASSSSSLKDTDADTDDAQVQAQEAAAVSSSSSLEKREPVPKVEPIVVALAKDDEEQVVAVVNNSKKSKPAAVQRRKSLSKLQSPKKFTKIIHKNQAKEEEKEQESAPKSKIAPPKATSRLTTTTSSTKSSSRQKNNPSNISIRTGKQLSAIPSESVPPITPLVDRTASQMDQEVQEQEKIKAKRLQKSSTEDNNSVQEEQSSSHHSSSTSSSVRRQISFTDDKDAGSVSSRGSSASSSSRRRRQSSVGRRRKSEAAAAVSTSSNSSSLHRRKSSISAGSTNAAQAENANDNNATPMVHDGGVEADNWRTKVEHLREDNEAEHTLFCDDQAEQELLFDYDMRIRVIVRKRPVSKTEASLSGGIDVIHPLDYGDYGRVLVYQPKTRVDLTKEIETIPFSYDNVFGEASTNVQIYNRSVRNLIYPFFEGQMTTVFAYGQTGSGKTYTMMGSDMTGINAGTAKHDESNLGLYYLAALDIFDMLQRPEYSHLTLGVSLFEIYSGKLFDLINGRKLIKCLEDSRGKVCFPGLTEHPISGPDRLMELINEGATNRSTGTTSRNADSSRSHAVLQLSLRKTVGGRKKNVEHGRMTFIDLAGSERGADTSSCSRATRLEGAEINTSLLALKEVIRALATGGNMTHIPFRGSKLTQVLKDSFVGERSRCCMVACISPDIGNCDQTLNTLRYADRVKERNPETGALAAGYEQPTRLRPMGQPVLPSPTNSEHSVDKEESSLVDPSESSPMGNDDSMREASFRRTFSAVSDGGDTAVLDDLLSSSSPESSSVPALALTEDSDAPPPRSSKDRAGAELVAAHRTVMSSMLAMVKDEMMLVNKVDADRDGLDDYLVELEAIHRTHMEYVTTLRNSLHNYVNKIESADGGAHSDDDSFEDLRD